MSVVFDRQFPELPWLPDAGIGNWQLLAFIISCSVIWLDCWVLGLQYIFLQRLYIASTKLNNIIGFCACNLNQTLELRADSPPACKLQVADEKQMDLRCLVSFPDPLCKRSGNETILNALTSNSKY